MRTERLQPARAARQVVKRVERIGRLSTASRRVLPDFLIIGAQKAGTTSLYHYLLQHPCVLAPERKEVHYFDNNFGKSLKWYRSHFPLKAGMATQSHTVNWRVVTGEATPFYMFHPDGPRRIASVVPGARLIVILREPVSRALSHYHHERRNGVEELGFLDAIAKEPERLQSELDALGETSYDRRDSAQRHSSYMTRGRYAEQLVRVFEVFPRSQVLVLFSEDLFAKPVATYERVCGFLGLPVVAPRDISPRNRGAYVRDADEAMDRLREQFSPYDSHLRELLSTDLPW